MKNKQKVASKVSLAAALALVILVPFSAQAANKLIVKDATGTTDKFVVTDTGYIGVGNNNPGTPVDITGSNTLSSQIRTRMIMDNNNGGGGYIGYLNRVTGSTLPLNGDRLGYFLFGSLSPVLTGGAPTPLNSIGLNFLSEGDWSFDGTTKIMPGAISFATTGPGPNEARTEKLRISSSGNVGIGTTTPGQKLEVNGGIKINTTASKPACDATSRGTMWFTQGASNVADTLEFCAKDASNAYAWKVLF